MMHSMTARVLRVLGGLWLVIYGAELSPGYAFMLAILARQSRSRASPSISAMELKVRA